MSLSKVEHQQTEHFPVLRAVQLDTSELDETLLVNLKQLLNQDLFKYIQFGLLQKYHVEIFALVKLFIWCVIIKQKTLS